MLTAVIVEDEHHSREALKCLVSDFCEEVEIVAVAEGVQSGIEIIVNNQPDLVFLDIEMQDGTGFDILEQAKNLDFEVIFTTAFEHYALKAIKFSAIDYLLKPIDFEDLQKAVGKVAKKQGLSTQNKKLTNLLTNLQAKNNQQHTIILSTAEGYEFIPVTEIVYCKADGSYTQFHLKQNKKLVVSKHLKEYEHLLLDYNFYRVHQSYLINLNEVEKFIRSDGGYLIMRNGDEIGISSKKKEEFINLMRSQ